MEYVSKVALEIDGQEITDFEEVEEQDVELHKKVELMDKTGVAELTPRYGVRVKYVIPKDAPEFNFRSVKNGRLTIDRRNGDRITFIGVYPLKIGATTYGREEARKDVEFVATDRKEE